MLVIRPATRNDAFEMLEIYRPFVESTAVSFEREVPTVDVFADRFEGRFPCLVAEDDGVIGYAYASRHRTRWAYQWSVETSVYVAPSGRRRGVAGRLYEVLFGRLRDAGFVNAYAGISLPNEASVAFHESVGFAHVGVYRRVGFKLGRWHDVGWWALRLQEVDEPVAVGGSSEV